MTPNVYRASDGWTREDIAVIEILMTLCRRPQSHEALFTAGFLLPAWIDEAPTKEPAR